MKVKKLLLLGVALIMLFPLFLFTGCDGGTSGLAYSLVQTTTDGKPYKYYSVSVGTATESGRTEIVIPAKYKGTPVEKISENGFYDNYQDNGVRTNAITSVTIPASVKRIGDGAFFNCTSLKSVSFASDSKLEYVRYSAFRNCISLESIEFPASVIYLDGAFWGCTSLESITFAIGSQLKDISGYTFIYEPNEPGLKSIEIPASVRHINDRAFGNYTSLESVTFASGSRLEDIGIQAFYRTSIKSIEIPGRVKYISNAAFRECKNLESIVIPVSVEKIYPFVFYECERLTDIYFLGTKKQWDAIEKTDAMIPEGAAIWFHWTSG